MIKGELEENCQTPWAPPGDGNSGVMPPYNSGHSSIGLIVTISLNNCSLDSKKNLIIHSFCVCFVFT